MGQMTQETRNGPNGAAAAILAVPPTRTDANACYALKGGLSAAVLPPPILRTSFRALFVPIHTRNSLFHSIGDPSHRSTARRVTVTSIHES